MRKPFLAGRASPLSDRANPHEHSGSRVLMLVENEPYPADTRVRLEAEELVRAGHAVTVIGPTDVGAEELHEVVRDVCVHRYKASSLGSGRVWGYVAEYLLSLVRLWTLARVVADKWEPAVIIAASPPDLVALVARLVAGRRAAVIFDHHDLSPELFEAKFGQRPLWMRLLLIVERLAFMSADVVISSNDEYAAVARGRGRFPSERVFVVRNAPSLDRVFSVPSAPGLRRGRDRLVLWLGRIGDQRGLGYLLDAAELLVQQQGREDIAFAIVGGGDGLQAVAADVRRRGLEDYVALPGHVGDDMVRAYLATADVCVSTEARTPFNDVSWATKVLEYMAAGRAVVQFPLTGMRHACGDTTVYARNADSTDFARHIAALLDDDVERERLGTAARRRVLNGLTWPDQTPALRRAVEEAQSIAGRARFRAVTT